jgi:hypothetical protein
MKSVVMIKIFAIFSICILFTECKINLVLKNSMENEFANKLFMQDPENKEQSQKQQEQSPKVTYITLLEGSREVYGSCMSICWETGRPLLYAEATDFPEYGKIFRCQCGNRWSSWYNMADLTELCVDVLLGDSIFNDYFNLLGYDTSDCQCDDLKALLHKLIS